MTEYFRPILNTDLSIPDNAQVMRGTHFWFTHAEKLVRNTEPQIVLAKNIPDNILANSNKSLFFIFFDYTNFGSIRCL